jgi:hypothetical protein
VVGGLDAERRVEGLVPVDPAILVIAALLIGWSHRS